MFRFGDRNRQKSYPTDTRGQGTHKATQEGLKTRRVTSMVNCLGTPANRTEILVILTDFPSVGKLFE